MCISGFPGFCRLDRCPKITLLMQPVAFTCDICGELVHVDELENAKFYESPEHKKACSTCAGTMTILDALVFLGCFEPWE